MEYFGIYENFSHSTRENQIISRVKVSLLKEVMKASILCHIQVNIFEKTNFKKIEKLISFFSLFKLGKFSAL